MSSQWYRRIETAVAALGLILFLLLLILPTVGVIATCLVLLPVLFFGLIPIPTLFARWDLLRPVLVADGPIPPSSFQRPPPFELA